MIYDILNIQNLVLNPIHQPCLLVLAAPKVLHLRNVPVNSAHPQGQVWGLGEIIHWPAE